MISKNKVELIGNLGQDPEQRTLQNGTMVCSFTLATSETYKDKAGAKQTITEWHNCVAWNKTAELISKYAKKGSGILVEGKLKTESYDKNGEKRYITKVVVSDFMLLDKATESKPQQENNVQYSNENDVFEQDDSDLPF